MTKIRLYDIVNSTTPESNKSQESLSTVACLGNQRTSIVAILN
jgi:hypothetical protein